MLNKIICIHIYICNVEFHPCIFSKSLLLPNSACECEMRAAAHAAGSKNCSGNRTPSDRKIEKSQKYPLLCNDASNEFSISVQVYSVLVMPYGSAWCLLRLVH